MTPVEPTTPIAVTLQAQEWNAVIDILYDGRCRIAWPLIQKISEQAQSAAGQAPEPPPPQPPLANGADSHVPD